MFEEAFCVKLMAPRACRFLAAAVLLLSGTHSWTVGAKRSGFILLQDKSLQGSTQFPTATTPPVDVVTAQLAAFKEMDVDRALSLFSRARRTMFADAGRAQSCPPPRDLLLRRVTASLREGCPGLLGHTSCEILSGLQIDEQRGRLPRFRCRVRVVRSHWLARGRRVALGA